MHGNGELVVYECLKPDLKQREKVSSISYHSWKYVTNKPTTITYTIDLLQCISATRVSASEGKELQSSIMQCMQLLIDRRIMVCTFVLCGGILYS